MTDQKLVDELEKALRDEAYDGGFGYMGDEQFPAYVRTLAETAAEVVEKAHTPTGDERGVLANLVQLGFVTDWYEAADRILAAGFSRSEKQPQGEPSDAQVEAAHQAWSDYWDRDEGGENRPAIRAALRAAGVTHG